MTTTLDAFQSQLIAAWQGLTPADDGSGKSFTAVDTKAEEQHVLDHRQFAFEAPSAVKFRETSGLRADWSVTVTLALRRRETTRNAFNLAVATDVRDLVRVLGDTTWTDGVLGVAFTESDIKIEPTEEPARSRRGVATGRYQAVRVTFALAVIGDETEDA